MPRLTDDTRSLRRAQIAQGAITQFLQHGLASTSMADIVAGSGLSSGSIYSHFDSKSDLIRYAAATILESRVSTLLLEAEESSFPPSPRRVLQALIDDGLGDRPRVSLVLQIWAEAQNDTELAELAADITAQLRATVTSAVTPWAEQHPGNDGATASTRAQQLSDLLLALLHGYAVRISIDPAVDPASLALSLVASLEN